MWSFFHLINWHIKLLSPFALSSSIYSFAIWKSKSKQSNYKRKKRIMSREKTATITAPFSVWIDSQINNITPPKKKKKDVARTIITTKDRAKLCKRWANFFPHFLYVCFFSVQLLQRELCLFNYTYKCPFDDGVNERECVWKRNEITTTRHSFANKSNGTHFGIFMFLWTEFNPITNDMVMFRFFDQHLFV